MEKIVIFKGSKVDFETYIEKEGVNRNYTPFMELIRQYNAKVRASDTYATKDSSEFDKRLIENVVIYGDDFSSVTNHVITNFPNIVLFGHNIRNLYIQNPPKRVEYSIRVGFENLIVEEFSDYYEPYPDELVSLYNNLNDKSIIGQTDAKKKTCVSLYKKASLRKITPVVLMYFGPSGVGKTELAKKISEFYKGKLTRIQFSMMQTEEAYKYIFGDEHGRPSLARDLLARESNVVLIDEFDKVNLGLYNVFYQMFDEGEFEDINYKVDVSRCVFILTTNFKNEEHIAKKLGMPLYSRIDNKVQFKELTNDEVREVIKKHFNKIIIELSQDEVDIINNYNLKQKYLESVATFRNIRLLDKFIENDIYTLIFEHKLKRI